ncbi:MAG: maleylpyruvate isomerase family mycothiol-dependent enzyme [Thermocrispum sp.]
MQMPEQLAAMQAAGERLAVAAESAGLAAEVPSCPGWTVRELLFHTGGVHRWAATIVAEARAESVPQVAGDPLRDAQHRPADERLVGWFAEGHAALVRTLREAPRDVACWTFLRAPTPLEFWVRRQTHETTIHRVDAELAAGEQTQVETAVAMDGIDELLAGFVTRRGGRLRTEQPRTLSVQATDVPAAWHLTVSAEPVVTVRTDEPCAADATLRGAASELYLALWNRLSFGALDAFGDAELLGLWPRLVRVVWG